MGVGAGSACVCSCENTCATVEEGKCDTVSQERGEGERAGARYLLQSLTLTHKGWQGAGNLAACHEPSASATCRLPRTQRHHGNSYQARPAPLAWATAATGGRGQIFIHRKNKKNT